MNIIYFHVFEASYLVLNERLSSEFDGEYKSLKTLSRSVFIPSISLDAWNLFSAYIVIE